MPVVHPELGDVPETVARWGSGPLLVALGVVASILVGRALLVALRERDPVPPLVCLGGVLAVVNEPIYDLLGRIAYASNQPILYTSFEGREIPVFLVFGYVIWVSVFGLGYARLMVRRVAPALFYKLATACFLSVVVVEVIGNTSGMWIYYGESPAKWLVVAPQLAPLPLVCGFMIHQLRPRVRGVLRVAYLAVPGVALSGVFAATTWPVYFVLGSDVPALWNWAASGIVLALSVGIVWVVVASVADASPEVDARPPNGWSPSPVERGTRPAPTGVATARRPMPEARSNFVT